uniref:Uncharacterized protein n=1 Tax=Arundo donax TaxID=35708 RepID=A0A0A9GHW5_ARUDO
MKRNAGVRKRKKSYLKLPRRHKPLKIRTSEN